MKKILILLAVFFCTLFSVQAATLYGAVFDKNLNQIDNALLEINTTPKQQYIAKDGAYFFNAPFGSFEIIVEVFYQRELVHMEKRYIEVTKDGGFQIDFVLNVTPGIDFPIEEDEGPSLPVYIIAKYGRFLVIAGAAFLVFVAIIVFAYLKMRKKSGVSLSFHSDHLHKDEDVSTVVSYGKEEESEYDLDQVLKIIEEEGGRTTQRDIRRKIPLSEAKVSLMISELESKGKIEKIKKGRGNIIVKK